MCDSPSREVDAIDPERKYLSAVKLPDGGYFGMLHAYHEATLHCECDKPLRWPSFSSASLTAEEQKHLRRFLYADYYTRIWC